MFGIHTCKKTVSCSKSDLIKKDCKDIPMTSSSSNQKIEDSTYLMFTLHLEFGPRENLYGLISEPRSQHATIDTCTPCSLFIQNGQIVLRDRSADDQPFTSHIAQHELQITQIALPGPTQIVNYLVKVGTVSS